MCHMLTCTWGGEAGPAPTCQTSVVALMLPAPAPPCPYSLPEQVVECVLVPHSLILLNHLDPVVHKVHRFFPEKHNTYRGGGRGSGEGADTEFADGTETA